MTGNLYSDTCINCGSILTERIKRLTNNSNFCSADCRKSYQHKIVMQHRLKDIPTSVIGSIGELTVAIDLFKRGYEVFRGMNQLSSCDLIGLRNGTTTRFEVRVAFRNMNNHIIVNRKHKADILAIVLHDGILYEPTLT